MTHRREVRRADAADLAEIVEVFWQAVHIGAAAHYDASQRAAWLPRRPTVEAFAARLDGQTVFVATEAARIAGFMTLRADGYLDLAFVRPEARGSGTADALYAAVLNHAAASGLHTLAVRASDMARSFLRRRGWQTVAPAPQIRAGVTLPSTDMTLGL